MATSDVPGANKANIDELAAGAWAEHEDKSLLYVKGTENDQVVYELYDVAQDPPVYYQDAMRAQAFKDAFSFPPVGQSKEKWTWHDKTPFPWSRVMKTFDRPVPMPADVHDTLTAAARVAESLRLKAQRLVKEQVAPNIEQEAPKVGGSGKRIIDRLQKALDAFMEE